MIKTYKGVEYYRRSDGWIVNKVRILFNRLQPPTEATTEINRILDRELKLKRILMEKNIIV